MRLRTITIVVCVIDAVVWVGVALATFWSGSDPATEGLDRAAGGAVTALFALTAAPALVLTHRRRASRTALTLALAFPAVVALLFVVAIVAFQF